MNMKLVLKNLLLLVVVPAFVVVSICAASSVIFFKAMPPENPPSHSEDLSLPDEQFNIKYNPKQIATSQLLWSIYQEQMKVNQGPLAFFWSYDTLVNWVSFERLREDRRKFIRWMIANRCDLPPEGRWGVFGLTGHKY